MGWTQVAWRLRCWSKAGHAQYALWQEIIKQSERCDVQTSDAREGWHDTDARLLSLIDVLSPGSHGRAQFGLFGVSRTDK